MARGERPSLAAHSIMWSSTRSSATAQRHMTTARRHHYVPQFYLRGFSPPRKKVRQVVVFDRNRRAPFQSPIANIAAERDFNQIDVEGLDPNAFEEAMARIEGELALALQRIITVRSLRARPGRG